MSTIVPYLCFAGNSGQAMKHYQKVFGGTLTVYTFGESGTEDPELVGKVMHSLLETTSGFTLRGADSPPGVDFAVGNNVAISLSGGDAHELRSYWQRLADGGQVTVPLEKQMWGDDFGMCVDKFGVTWAVSISEKWPL